MSIFGDLVKGAASFIPGVGGIAAGLAGSLIDGSGNKSGSAAGGVNATGQLQNSAYQQYLSPTLTSLYNQAGNTGYNAPVTNPYAGLVTTSPYSAQVQNPFQQYQGQNAYGNLSTASPYQAQSSNLASPYSGQVTDPYAAFDGTGSGGPLGAYGSGGTGDQMINSYSEGANQNYDNAVQSTLSDLAGRGLTNSSFAAPEVGAIRQQQASDNANFARNVGVQNEQQNYERGVAGYNQGYANMVQGNDAAYNRNVNAYNQGVQGSDAAFNRGVAGENTAFNQGVAGYNMGYQQNVANADAGYNRAVQGYNQGYDQNVNASNATDQRMQQFLAGLGSIGGQASGNLSSAANYYAQQQAANNSSLSGLLGQIGQSGVLGGIFGGSGGTNAAGGSSTPYTDYTGAMSQGSGGWAQYRGL